MIDSHKVLWDNCLEMIQANVSEQQFKTWFATIVFESFSEKDRILLLQVPSTYAYEYLEQYYVGLLSKVISHCFGPNVTLRYRLVTEQARSQAANAAAATATSLPVSGGPQPVVSTSPQPSAVPPQPAARPQTYTQPRPLAASQPRQGMSPQTVRQPAASGSNRQETPMRQGLNPQLNLRQTFNNYIEGNSNKLPRTIGLSIAEHPGKSTFNPFFIYGPSGCGKTHLVNAIGVRCKELYPQRRVLYVSARLFQVQFTDAVRQNLTNDFLNFYQSIDVLIVDDIQEWATAAKTLDTFFHIFNHLFRNGKQIILASDRPPVELQGMKDRLLTRFSCGLIAELEKPNTKLCVDILNTKCRRDGLKIPEDVIEFIARTANGSVRDLQGVINSLLAFSVVYNSHINVQLAERIIKRSVKIDDRPVTIDDILDKVCTHYGITLKNVFSRSRKREYVIVRQVSMYLAQKYTKLPATRIGELVGGRDHSTVIHSCATVEKRLQVDKSFAAELDSIENSFKLKQEVPPSK